jgi:hypothetical protein
MEGCSAAFTTGVRQNKKGHYRDLASSVIFSHANKIRAKIKKRGTSDAGKRDYNVNSKKLPHPFAASKKTCPCLPAYRVYTTIKYFLSRLKPATPTPQSASFHCHTRRQNEPRSKHTVLAPGHAVRETVYFPIHLNLHFFLLNPFPPTQRHKRGRKGYVPDFPCSFSRA